MFDDIDSLDSLPPRQLAPAPDRRAAVRYRCPPAAPVRLFLSEAEETLGWAYNLSGRGMAVLADRPLAAGAGVGLELVGVRGDGLRRPARVAHATRRADGTWLVGCAFLQPVSPEDVEAFLP
jgi:hypothetical protein